MARCATGDEPASWSQATSLISVPISPRGRKTDLAGNYSWVSVWCRMQTMHDAEGRGAGHMCCVRFSATNHTPTTTFSTCVQQSVRAFDSEQRSKGIGRQAGRGVRKGRRFRRLYHIRGKLCTIFSPLFYFIFILPHLPPSKTISTGRKADAPDDGWILARRRG